MWNSKFIVLWKGMHYAPASSVGELESSPFSSWRDQTTAHLARMRIYVPEGAWDSDKQDCRCPNNSPHQWTLPLLRWPVCLRDLRSQVSFLAYPSGIFLFSCVYSLLFAMCTLELSSQCFCTYWLTYLNLFVKFTKCLTSHKLWKANQGTEMNRKKTPSLI